MQHITGFHGQVTITSETILPRKTVLFSLSVECAKIKLLRTKMEAGCSWSHALQCLLVCLCGAQNQVKLEINTVWCKALNYGNNCEERFQNILQRITEQILHCKVQRPILHHCFVHVPFIHFKLFSKGKNSNKQKTNINYIHVAINTQTSMHNNKLIRLIKWKLFLSRIDMAIKIVKLAVCSDVIFWSTVLDCFACCSATDAMMGILNVREVWMTTCCGVFWTDHQFR